MRFVEHESINNLTFSISYLKGIINNLYEMFEEKCFQIYPILESNCLKIDNLIEMNLYGFQFDSFIIIQRMILEMKEQNIFQMHYNIMLHYYH